MVDLLSYFIWCGGVSMKHMELLSYFMWDDASGE